MAKVERSIRLIGRTAGDLDSITGAPGEIFLDSSSQTLRVYDGNTLGGLAVIPAQTAQSGKYLTTNGTTVSWGTVTVTAASVGLGNVTNESKATMFASPTFTGTVSGVTATHVGLGSVTNESKATMFTSPTFTGTVVLLEV